MGSVGEGGHGRVLGGGFVVFESGKGTGTWRAYWGFDGQTHPGVTDRVRYTGS